jgi:3-deoxy-7-phosphoheptulonate synthase
LDQLGYTYQSNCDYHLARIRHLAIMTTTENGAPEAWTPGSWRSKPVKQSPDYPDKKSVARSIADLQRLPPIVHPKEIAQLRQDLKDVAEGKAFLLQGGDCAELFDYCEQGAIESKIKLLLQMSLVLIWGLEKRVVRIGRMAGQYAKPRSSPTEMVDGREVPSFRGDILNGFHLDERELDPGRLVRYVDEGAGGFCCCCCCCCCKTV